MTLDLRPERIESALELIDPVFRGTPQFVDQRLSAALGREVVMKVETLNPIGSFKARGASVLVRDLDPARTWVCSTAGNFGQALAYLARQRHASVHVFASPQVAAYKVARMRALGLRGRPCASCAVARTVAPFASTAAPPKKWSGRFKRR